jgi:hypothetical protein
LLYFPDLCLILLTDIFKTRCLLICILRILF